MLAKILKVNFVKIVGEKNYKLLSKLDQIELLIRFKLNLKNVSWLISLKNIQTQNEWINKKILTLFMLEGIVSFVSFTETFPVFVYCMCFTSVIICHVALLPSSHYPCRFLLFKPRFWLKRFWHGDVGSSSVFMKV